MNGPHKGRRTTVTYDCPNNRISPGSLRDILEEVQRMGYEGLPAEWLTGVVINGGVIKLELSDEDGS